MRDSILLEKESWYNREQHIDFDRNSVETAERHPDQTMRPSLTLTIQNKALTSLFLIVATCAVYWQVGNHQFVNYDDGKYILENPHVRTGPTGEGFLWAFASTYASNWHPLGVLTTSFKFLM